MPTYVPRPTDIRNDWYLLDCEDQVLGRLATRAAVLLMGKHKPDYTPFLKTGDHVIVVNAQKIKVTGKKEEQKKYYRHSGYPGGLKTESYEHVVARKPSFPMEEAVRGMLPKGRLGRKLFGNVKIYSGASHPHVAQQPKELSL